MNMSSWLTIYPDWYLSEINLLDRFYPDFTVDQNKLSNGRLVIWGKLTIRPPSGPQTYCVMVVYPQSTPYRHPIVYPVDKLPEDDINQNNQIKVVFFDKRHQMPEGNLCLFQRETRMYPGGDVLGIHQVLRRAEKWFLGSHTNKWPPDTAESELEAHFVYAGDVLLADCFFSEEIQDRGRFNLIPDHARILSKSSAYNTNFPLIVTAMTYEKNLIRTVDARSELSQIYPWIEASCWDPNIDASRGDRDRSIEHSTMRGYWWALKQEPNPFHNGEGFLKELSRVVPGSDSWKMITEALPGELRTANQHFFALNYPSRSGGIEWLFLMLKYPSRASKGIARIESDLNRVIKPEFESTEVSCIRVNSLQKENLWKRNQTVIDRTIQSKKLALIGLGALGSKIAELLAQAGVGQIKLCDLDVLKPVNVARHLGGISDFGMLKTDLVIKRLININPSLTFTKTDIISHSIDSNLDELANFISDVDLVISTTADENVESVINQIAVTTSTPVLYGRSVHKASIGRVFLVRPHKDACKACLGSYLQTGREGEPIPSDWIDIPETSEDVLQHECGRPVIAGSAADLSFIASLTSRVAIDYLENNLTNMNHWIWSKKPATDIDSRLNKPFSTFEGNLPPDPSCPVCRTPPLSGIVISDAVRQTIISETTNSPDAETGGILLGHIDSDNKAIITKATGPGPKAIKSKTCFRRDVEYVQQEIDDALQVSEGQCVYLGEWHSHLVPNPEPSATDINSLSEIAHQSNYLTPNPIMIIAGFNPETSNVDNILSWVFVPSGRFFKLPIAPSTMT